MYNVKWLLNQQQILNQKPTDTHTFFYFTQVSALPNLMYHMYKTTYYENGEHTLLVFRLKTEDTQTRSELEVKTRESKLACNVKEVIKVGFTFVGEAPGPVDIMYLVSKMSK